MTIALDYDLTWTADPSMWRSFVILAQACGHRVIMVTGRSGWSSDMERGEIPDDMDIYYTNRKLKKPHMEGLGVKVDVWCDDSPGMIEECTILNTEGEL